jgi:plasmid stabilization system protein ParE
VPVEVVWSVLALSRLQEIRAFVGQDKPEAAARLATRIVAVVENLREHPYLGRAGAEAGSRELVIGGTPYVVLYRV